MSKEHTQMNEGNCSPQRARSSYNRLSRWYDLLSFGMENKPGNLAVNALASRPGERVLEIGFGTGHALVELSKRVGLEGKVFGIDISEGMLKVARARVKRTKLEKRISLMQGDAQFLPFGSNTFDSILINFTLELFAPPAVTLVLFECRRTLRETGRICVLGLSKNGEPNLMIHLYEWLHKKIPQFVDCRPIYVRAALENTGFFILDATSLSLAGLHCELVLAEKLQTAELAASEVGHL